MSNPRPLEGIRILDFTLIWAGPYGVMLLSDLGAEVIRVESCHHHIPNTRGFFPKPSKEITPTLGTLGRAYADMDPRDEPWNRHALFNTFGRDRYAMTVDLRRPEGQEAVQELVKISDVLMDNNTNRLLEGFGLGYETVRKLNPTLIQVAMPIFGLSGPYKDYVGFGANAEALTGFSSLRAYLDGDPTMIGTTNHMDAASGIGVAFAVLMAIHERDQTGRGQFIEFGQMEHMIHQIGGPLMDAAMNARDQAGIGNRDAIRAPQGIYPCAGDDRWLALTVGTDEEWAALCRVMGRLELAADPRYEGNHARQARHDELDELIAAWTRGQDPIQAMRAFQEAGVPAANCANDQDEYECPHLEARGFFQWKEHPSCGRHRYPGHPYRLRETPLRYDRPAPLLGEHNDLVYRQLLGKPEEEIRRLTEQGHIGTAYSEEAIRAG